MSRLKVLLTQLGLTGIGAWISAKLGIMFPLIIALAVLMVIDYIAGVWASKVEAVQHPNDPAYGWSSKKGG